MTRFLGARGASAVVGLCMLSVVSSAASAQTAAAPTLDVKAAVQATEAVGSATQPVATSIGTTAPAAASASATTPTVSALYATSPAKSVTVSLPTASTSPSTQTSLSKAAPDIAREAAWLYSNGWPLYALVDRYSAAEQLDEQANCIAVAVYHEARGESPEGQLAVARVIMNRALSGKYPASWCGVVKQPWQFSFVSPRTGLFPYTDTNSAAWRKAVAITKLAVGNIVPSLSTDVLWYHADYVAPSWGRRLSFVQKIGTHIFYRS